MNNDRPGFRRAGESAGSSSRVQEEVAAISRSPFSQAQITQLMKTEFARARRHEYPLTCMLIQIDRLQQLADVHGAEIKAELRRRVSAVVDEKTRGHDSLGAMSDGSYLLVLPHTDADEARLVADRILGGFAGAELTVSGKALPLTASVGIAASADRDTMFFDTLVSQAEVALEWAEREGGGHAVVFEREKFVGRQS